MTADAHLRERPAQLDSLVDRLGKRHFRDTPLSIGDNGLVVAQFYRSRVTTAFQPIVRAQGGACVGHHALLRVESRTGESIAPWSLFAQASSDPALVALDRLCRTVHALNYFPSHHGDELLFLNVERRLLTGVSADHGAWFEAILALIGTPARRVVIVMPIDAVENPVAFVRAAISYRIRGYRVRRTRTIKYASGAPAKTETTYDFYPPTTEIYLVSPGTDPNELPSLPEDVKEMLAKKNGEPIPSPTATVVASARRRT